MPTSIYASTCVVWNGFHTRYVVTSLCGFSFVFPWQWLILSPFYIPLSLFLLWRILCLGPLLVFNWDFFFFTWRCMKSLHILDINLWSDMWFENIFSLYIWSFHSVDNYLCYAEALQCYVVPLVYVCCLCLDVISKNHCQNPCHNVSPLCFLLVILVIGMFQSLIYFELFCVCGIR